MSGRSRVIGLAIAIALLASGVVNNASAFPGVCKPVGACQPVKAAPVVPVCKPVTALPAPEVCKPVKILPPPEVCKPVNACDGVDAHVKHVAFHDHVIRLVSHFKKHGTGKEVYYDAPQSAPSSTPPAPAPAPQSHPA